MKKASGKSPAKAGAQSPARRAASKKSATRKEPAPRASKNILAAGIKALSNVHEEAITRQSRVFESILGLNAKREPASSIDEKSTSPLAAALDPFGFRKFEDVFDQRVARALANLAAPSGQDFAALTSEVERLRLRVVQLELQLDPQAKKR